MANPNLTDMTEEDAADLQFPKENLACVTTENNDNDNAKAVNNEESDDDLEVSIVTDKVFPLESTCRSCKAILSEPYVRCAECSNVKLCTVCFSKGSEIDGHKNDHDYAIAKNEFPLIEESGWMAGQELRLLDVLQECGYGNWKDIATRMQGKSTEECKNHYLKYYIDHQGLPNLPKIKENRTSLFASAPIPYLFKLQDLEEPPRFASNSANSRLLAGYNAARSDFHVNFDNHAESLISDIDYAEFQAQDEHYELGRSLQASIVQAYNNRLRERMRRKKIIRDHGLIAFRRTMSWLQRYEVTITRPIAERLLIFMQLVGGIEFDFIVEGLHQAGEIRNCINKLVEYRANGLRTFRSISMFKRLSRLRRESERERKQYTTNSEYCWKSFLPHSTISPNFQIAQNLAQRKIPPPLEIRGLPGSEKLTIAEKDLCSSSRIVPGSYFDYKRILINENKKLGSLKLAQARVLLKIDVNKTRKIYDFLAENGFINKPAQ